MSNVFDVEFLLIFGCPHRSFKFSVVYVWVCLACLNAVKEVTCGRQESICGTYNGRRLYLELGDKGILYSGNATIHQKSNQVANRSIKQ